MNRNDAGTSAAGAKHLSIVSHNIESFHQCPCSPLKMSTIFTQILDSDLAVRAPFSLEDADDVPQELVEDGGELPL